MGGHTSMPSFGLARRRQCSFANGMGGGGGGGREVWGRGEQHLRERVRPGPCSGKKRPLSFLDWHSSQEPHDLLSFLALFTNFCVSVFQNRREVKENLRSTVSATVWSKTEIKLTFHPMYDNWCYFRSPTFIYSVLFKLKFITTIKKCCERMKFMNVLRIN